MNNYYDFWSKKIIRQGLKAIKIVIGLGLAFTFLLDNRLIGGLFFGWVLIESLLDRE
jgi:hypothetical protein